MSTTSKCLDVSVVCTAVILKYYPFGLNHIQQDNKYHATTNPNLTISPLYLFIINQEPHPYQC